MAEQEINSAQIWRTQLFSIIAVIITGFFAIYATLLKPEAPPPAPVVVTVPAK